MKQLTSIRGDFFPSPHHRLRAPTRLAYLGTHPQSYCWLNGLATDLWSFTLVAVARVAEIWWPLTARGLEVLQNVSAMREDVLRLAASDEVNVLLQFPDWHDGTIVDPKTDVTLDQIWVRLQKKMLRTCMPDEANKRAKPYFQLRLIDAVGQEVLRIERSGRNSFQAMDRESLRDLNHNRAARVYFRKCK